MYKLFIFTTLILGSILAQEQPNILWLTSEDNNINWVGAYGNPYADTPNIDALAKEGFLYTHAYANAPVCASSRSTWITGILALSMGTHPMRSRYDIPHDKIQYYPDLLKEAGYYCSNVVKTDYNIGGRADNDCWDSTILDWNLLKTKQPFFQFINSAQSHEAHAFGDITKSKRDPQNVRLAKYHPDILVMRQNYNHYHDAVKRMDDHIGKLLNALKRNGLEENTIVIYNSDHGGVLPRSKRFLYNSGTHCPLIIRIPEKFKHLWPATKTNSKVDHLVSFVDMTKTWLSITGSNTPSYLQGNIFLGPNKEPERPYHFSFRTRMDERCDNVRAIRNKQFLYIRNYMPYAPRGQKLSYLWKMKATQAWEYHHKENKTDEITGRFFQTKIMEELYDTSKDPDNINNLIDQVEYKEVIRELRTALNNQQKAIYDAGMLPESEVVEKAKQAQLTIYDYVRDPKLYPLNSYLETSEIALQNDPVNLKILVDKLQDNDSGIRYWATVGLFNLQDQITIDPKLIEPLLNDKSHHVRVMAAWILYKNGNKNTARNTWNQLLRDSSYASLKIFNVIDWIKDDPNIYLESMIACRYQHGHYINKMKEQFGITH
ncbi:sulfatase-like hydrolase/transferase [Lentisphaera profundi]|uniref:Sulfatase-like hydrolase/transferase n=1 Tax=Lentisphaera profundi TaxID=1658616 RepID=A0ABY7VUN2_9BACT|nr:sulfatase-like hydrolase/transferase [Lentisphaera profundi]WDE97923.1 sulfatase-like hydrolase/transferase [Lentisphaera profundi]